MHSINASAESEHWHHSKVLFLLHYEDGRQPISSSSFAKHEMPATKNTWKAIILVGDLIQNSFETINEGSIFISTFHHFANNVIWPSPRSKRPVGSMKRLAMQQVTILKMSRPIDDSNRTRNSVVRSILGAATTKHNIRYKIDEMKTKIESDTK